MTIDWEASLGGRAATEAKSNPESGELVPHEGLGRRLSR